MAENDIATRHNLTTNVYRISAVLLHPAETARPDRVASCDAFCLMRAALRATAEALSFPCIYLCS